MAISTSYLTSLKNLKAILQSIQGAQAPKTFSTRFLASLGYASTNDRLIIGVLKSLGFLSPEGTPTKRYYEYLDQTQSSRVLAQGIREAYADLFQVNRKANEMSQGEVKNKLKTLMQGKFSDVVLGKMASTFKSLSQLADFSPTPETSGLPTKPDEGPAEGAPPLSALELDAGPGVSLGGLVYNIQLVLPAERDQAVYDALFRSLKDHLLK
jgi:hypothetical protein